MAESAKPPAAEKATPPRLNIVQRLAAIRAECDAIGKQDIKMEKDGKSWTIKGHTVEAVLSEIRPLFVKHGVSILPNLAERTYSGNRCDVLIEWEFSSLDDMTDAKVIRWGGSGTDNGDKAYAKACTNSAKELMKKVFLVTDRDDAKEEEESVEHRAEGGASRDEVDQAKERARGALEKWAVTFKSALDNAGTEKEVDRLRADNMDQLNDDALPSVTRQFFFDHIQRRKADLKGR